MATGVRHLTAEAFDAFGAPVSVWEVVYTVFVKLGLRRQHWRSLDTSGLYFFFCTLDDFFGVSRSLFVSPSVLSFALSPRPPPTRISLEIVGLKLSLTGVLAAKAAALEKTCYSWSGRSAG